MEGGVFKTKGYAEFAMSTLKRVRVIRLRRGGLKTFGGNQEPSQEVQRRCLQRMSAWAKLAIEVVQTEFPHWEIFQSFSILSLSSLGGKKARENEEEYTLCVKRLAQKFNLDAPALAAEIDDYRSLALHIYTTQKLTAGSAWVEALKRRADRNSILKTHPQSNLRKVVIRLPVYAPSTSGVEQSFTRIKWDMGESRRGAMSEESEVVAAKLLLDRRQEEEHTVLEVIWCGSFWPY